MKKIKPDTIFSNGEYIDARTGNVRKRWWTKARIPGIVRKSRMPGGCGFRGYKTYEGAGA